MLGDRRAFFGLWCLLAACAPPAPSPAPASPPAPVAIPAPAPPPAPEPAPPGDRYPAPFTTEPAPRTGTVVWLADGDTFDIELSTGKVRVRLLGVDTPEKDTEHTRAEPWGEEVSRLVARRLYRQPVELIADLTATDAYGRVLGYVHHDGEDLGAWLLRQGYAELFRRADHPRRARYEPLEAEARAAKRGMWGPPPSAPAFIGNARSKLLHTPDCQHLPTLPNRVHFADRASAEAAGFEPHPACMGRGARDD